MRRDAATVQGVGTTWEHEHKLDQVNPNGGALGLGYALRGTGCVLTMCCGGGLATGMLEERI